MRTLLIDNHDAYTFNLAQLIAEVNGVDPIVVANDSPALATMWLGDFGNIVISPGPGQPQNDRDVGQVTELLRNTTLPVLGVCLGHQAIAHVAGASVGMAPLPAGGHLATVTHRGDDLFAGIPTEFVAVRYHSLCVQEPLPATLEATADDGEGTIMALRHRDLPRWGVQFQLASIASTYGREILANFRDLSLTYHAERRETAGTASTQPPQGRPAPAPGMLRLVTAVVPTAIDTEAAFLDLFAAAPDCFWLDSGLLESGLSRFSYLGDASGPLSEVITYRLQAAAVKVRDASGNRVESGSAFDILGRRLRERAMADPGLPFDFTGGYVGYFGYEMKQDCGAGRRHEAATPDAAWIFADRLIAVDHLAGLTYVLALHDGEETVRAAAEEWAERTAARLAALPHPLPLSAEPIPGPGSAAVEPYLVRDRQQYVADVHKSQRLLMKGESYGICLSNTLRLPFDGDDADFYRRLRRAAPAPYAALLRIGDVAVFSSSPERFLRIRHNGTVESRPIRLSGVSARAQTENLMMVDLIRNDLGQVCETGSVRVEGRPVSTVRGKLSSNVGAVDCVRHCFPGASTTGVPKERTMEIIDRLETEARGVYSGALGYFGLTGGADLGITTRTAVRLRDQLSASAGGAVFMDSDAQQDFEQMLVNAAAPLAAWRPGAGAALPADPGGADPGAG